MRTEHAHARAHTHTHTCAFLQTFHSILLLFQHFSVADMAGAEGPPPRSAPRRRQRGKREPAVERGGRKLRQAGTAATLHAADFARPTNLCQADLQGADSVPGG